MSGEYIQHGWWDDSCPKVDGTTFHDGTQNGVQFKTHELFYFQAI